MNSETKHDWIRYFQNLLSYLNSERTDNINYHQILHDVINYVSNDNLIINDDDRLEFKNNLYQIIKRLKYHTDITLIIDNLFDITDKSNNTIKNIGSLLDLIGQIYTIDMLSHLNKIVNGVLNRGFLNQGVLNQGFLTSDNIKKYKLLKNYLNKSYINKLPIDVKKYTNKYVDYLLYDWIPISRLNTEELYKNPNAIEIIKKNILEYPNRIPQIISNISLNPNVQVLRIVEDYIKDHQKNIFYTIIFSNLLLNKNPKSIDIIFKYEKLLPSLLHNYDELISNPNVYNIKNYRTIIDLLNNHNFLIGNENNIYIKILLGLSSNPNGFDSFEQVLNDMNSFGWDIEEILNLGKDLDVHNEKNQNIDINILKNPDVRFFKYFDYPNNITKTDYYNIIDEIFTIGVHNFKKYYWDYLYALFETNNENILSKIDQYIEKEINKAFTSKGDITEYAILLKNPHAGYLILKYQNYFINISDNFFYEKIALNTNSDILNLINLSDLIYSFTEDLLNKEFLLTIITMRVLENLALNNTKKAFQILNDNWQEILALDNRILSNFWKNLSSNPNIFYLNIV
jgi:hypothetical protein